MKQTICQVCFEERPEVGCMCRNCYNAYLAEDYDTEDLDTYLLSKEDDECVNMRKEDEGK